MGIDFLLPEIIILDAQINKLNQTYYFQVVKYCFGSREDYSVRTHNLDGTTENMHYLDIPKFKEVEGAIVIRVLKRDPNKSFIHMADDRYIIPKAKRVLLDFSKDGRIFSVFVEKEDGTC